MALRHAAEGRCGLVQGLVEAQLEVRKRERGGARGHELDRQRDAVQAAADGLDRGVVVGGERDAHLLGPGEKEWYRIGAERAEEDSPLAEQAQGLPARGQHLEARAFGQQPLDDPRRLVDHVLAVVDDEQLLATAHRGDDVVLQLLTSGGLRSRIERSGSPRDGRDDETWSFDGCQVDEAGTVVERRSAVLGRGDCEPGLPDPADADHRHQSVALDRLRQRRPLALAADQLVEREGEGNRVQGPPRRVVRRRGPGRDPRWRRAVLPPEGMGDDRFAYALEVERPDRLEVELAPADDEATQRVGHQDLGLVGLSAQPGGDHDGHAEVPAIVVDERIAGVQPRP